VAVSYTHLDVYKRQTHARRCDLAGDGHGVRFYWLVPEGVRARVTACRLVLETNQPTRDVRLAVAVLRYDGVAPLPQRFRAGERLGLRVATAGGMVSASVGGGYREQPAIGSP